jgi:hypothetical protein
MKHLFSSMLVSALVLGLAPLPAFAGNGGLTGFTKEGSGFEAKGFSSLVGNWHLDRDDSRTVYAADGRNWEQGLLSAGARGKAKALYGERASEFLSGLEAYRYFPLAICTGCKELNNGSIEVSFKAISGRIDQAAGIAFHIRPNGNYLVVRANALEDNLVLFRMEQGRRSSVQWVRNVPIPSNQWHTLRVVIKGKKIEAYLNNRKEIDYTYSEDIGGKIGLWSKADSYVFFSGFTVNAK